MATEALAAVENPRENVHGTALQKPAPYVPPAPQAHTDDCRQRQDIPRRRDPLAAHYRKDPKATTCTCWCHVEVAPPAPRGRRRRAA